MFVMFDMFAAHDVEGVLTSEKCDHHLPSVINCEFRLVPLLSVGHPEKDRICEFWSPKPLRSRKTTGYFLAL